MALVNMLVNCVGLYTKYLFKSSSVLLFLAISLGSNVASAQTNRVTISVVSQGEVKVDAGLSTPSRSWSFRNAYAGVLGIAERVDDFRRSEEHTSELQSH